MHQFNVKICELHYHTSVSEPDVHLVNVIPEIFKVFNEALFVHLSKIVDCGVDQTESDDNIKEDQQKLSMDHAFAFFWFVKLLKVRNIDIKNYNVNYVK